MFAYINIVRSDDGLVNLKSEAFQTFITITDSGLQVTEEARTKFAIGMYLLIDTSEQSKGGH